MVTGFGDHLDDRRCFLAGGSTFAAGLDMADNAKEIKRFHRVP